LIGEREILVKKDGYQDQRIKLYADKNAPLNYQVFLEPLASVSQSGTVQKQKEIRTETKTTTAVTTPPAEKTTSITTLSGSGGMQEMYFIQIAALALHSSLDPYADLKTFGDLMLHDDGMYSKVRVGTFATEAEAKLVLTRIKSDGYKDAFVVKQAVEGGRGSISQAPAHTSEYKVRLGTYARIANFNPGLVMHLGSLESYRKDDLTIMLLAGYSNLVAAQKARDAAASQGFTDAYVVMDNDGVLERVR